MAGYVLLGKYTSSDTAGMKGAPDRVARAKELATAAGGKLVGIWWTLGQYDFVAVVDLPDDASAAAFAITSSAAGSFRSETMRAFSERELPDLLAKLP